MYVAVNWNWSINKVSSPPQASLFESVDNYAFDMLILLTDVRSLSIIRTFISLWKSWIPHHCSSRHFRNHNSYLWYHPRYGTVKYSAGMHPPLAHLTWGYTSSFTLPSRSSDQSWVMLRPLFHPDIGHDCPKNSHLWPKLILKRTFNSPSNNSNFYRMATARRPRSPSPSSFFSHSLPKYLSLQEDNRQRKKCERRSSILLSARFHSTSKKAPSPSSERELGKI